MQHNHAINAIWVGTSTLVLCSLLSLVNTEAGFLCQFLCLQVTACPWCTRSGCQEVGLSCSRAGSAHTGYSGATIPHYSPVFPAVTCKYRSWLSVPSFVFTSDSMSSVQKERLPGGWAAMLQVRGCSHTARRCSFPFFLP